MKKTLVFALGGILWVGVAAFVGSTVLAKVTSKHNVQRSTPEHTVTVSIPEEAVEVAPGVFSLGTANHEGKLVEGYAYIHYKENPAKDCRNDGVCQGWEKSLSCPDCESGGGGDDDAATCYGFLSKGTYWKTLEPYVVNPINTEGLNEDTVFTILSEGIEKWETAAGVNILGDGTSTHEELVADTIAPDNKNEVYFGDIDSPGAIGVTIVWGVFGGPPPFRELVEWDQIYDQVDFDWSLNEQEGTMDFDNIATHELGHSVGMDDLYTSDCAEQTMYGYASEGETKKRTLESGDIAGVKKLYD